MTGENQCALNLDGTLKDPSEINWYESEGDDQPIGTRTTNQAAGKLLVHCPQSIAHQSLFLLGLQQQSLHDYTSHILYLHEKVVNMHRNTNELTLSQDKWWLANPANPANPPNNQVDLFYHQMYLTMMLNSHHQVKVKYVTSCRLYVLTRCHELKRVLQYTILSRMADDYLAIQGSSTAFERAFSLGGLIVIMLRSSLYPENVEALQLLKSVVFIR